MTISPPAGLQALLDHQEISRILYLYCRGCDRADEAVLRACFHPEAHHRHGAFEGTSADFCTLALSIVRPLKACKHMLSNILIELDGNLAMSEAHYFSYHRRIDEATGTEEDYFGGGRYLDRFERRAGAWKIASRVGLIDFERYEPPADRTLWSGPAQRRDAPYRSIGGG